MKTARLYILGFGLSIALTLIAFGLTHYHLTTEHIFPPHNGMIAMLIALAVLQLFVQLVCFLHLGQEPKPRWNALVLVFASFIVIIVVGGTIWIMNHLMHAQDLSEIYPSGEISPKGQDD